MKKKGCSKLLWERKALRGGATIIIGLDEVGRGPLAGPVVSAAVTLRDFSFREKVDDSKKLVPKQREKAYQEILKKSLVALGSKDHRFIDRGNILKATLASMREAVKKIIKTYCRLKKIKERQIRNKICVLVDGNIKLDLPYKVVPILQGDSKSLSIACASIIAKVTRDKIMNSYDKIYPEYGFSKHKGYGTKLHLEAIQKFGPCAIHRRSFAPIRYL